MAYEYIISFFPEPQAHLEIYDTFHFIIKANVSAALST